MVGMGVVVVGGGEWLSKYLLYLGIVGYLAQLGGHLVKLLADVPVPAPVQLSLVLDQAQPQVVRSK